MKKQTVFLLLLLQRTLFGFAAGTLTYILSTYFMQASGHDEIGIYFLITAAATLSILLILHRLIALIGRTKLLLILIGGALLTTGALVFYATTLSGIIITVLYLIVSSVLFVILDMITEAFSSDAEDGRAYGALSTFFHIGFIAGPFFAGRIVEWQGFSGIFLVLVVVYAVMFILAGASLAQLSRLNHITHDGVLVLMRRAWRLRWFRHSYFLAVSLRFFYAIMVVYMPLHLLEQGFTLTQIGTLFTVMLIPFLVLGYPAGILADRAWGEREMLLFGIVLMIISVVIIIAVPLTSAVLWGVVLVISRIGAALLEGMSDIFFYKHVQDEHVGLIDLYRTADSVAYIVAMTAVGMFFFFVPASSFVPAFGAIIVVLLIGLYSAWCLHDTAIHKS